MRSAKSTYVHTFLILIFFSDNNKVQKKTYTKQEYNVSKSIQVSGSRDLLLKIVSIFCIVYPQLNDEKDQSAFHIALSVPNPVILHTISRCHDTSKYLSDGIRHNHKFSVLARLSIKLVQSLHSNCNFYDLLEVVYKL